MKHPRSFHFVPGTIAANWVRTRDALPDVFVFDLEDAVAPADKPAVRIAVEEAIGEAQRERPVYVRINGLSTPWGEEDLALAIRAGADGIVVPKLERREELEEVALKLPAPMQLLPLIETWSLLLRLSELPLPPQVVGLGVGLEDLTSREPRQPEALDLLADHLRMQVVLKAKAHDRLAIDSVFTGLGDPEGLARAAKRSVRQGFDAAFTIHPEQIPVVNLSYSLDPAAVTSAHALLDLAKRLSYSGGYAREGDVLLSPAKLERARAIVARAEESST